MVLPDPVYLILLFIVEHTNRQWRKNEYIISSYDRTLLEVVQASWNHVHLMQSHTVLGGTVLEIEPHTVDE